MKEKLFNKKIYDALNQRKVYQKFKEKRNLVFEKLGGKCEICEKLSKTFHLHHKIYHPIESNYPRHSKTMNIRIKRVNEAFNNPERFSLLCPRCHSLVTVLQSYKEKNKNIMLEKAIKLI